MSFFDMGIGEILLIIIVALVIWGPGKIPQIARTIGKTMATLKKASQDLTTQITRELEEEEKTSTGQKSEQGSRTDRTHPTEETHKDEGPRTSQKADDSKADSQ